MSYSTIKPTVSQSGSTAKDLLLKAKWLEKHELMLPNLTNFDISKIVSDYYNKACKQFKMSKFTVILTLDKADMPFQHYKAILETKDNNQNIFAGTCIIRIKKSLRIEDVLPITESLEPGWHLELHEWESKTCREWIREVINTLPDECGIGLSLSALTELTLLRELGPNIFLTLPEDYTIEQTKALINNLKIDSSILVPHSFLVTHFNLPQKAYQIPLTRDDAARLIKNCIDHHYPKPKDQPQENSRELLPFNSVQSGKYRVLPPYFTEDQIKLVMKDLPEGAGILFSEQFIKNPALTEHLKFGCFFFLTEVFLKQASLQKLPKNSTVMLSGSLLGQMHLDEQDIQIDYSLEFSEIFPSKKYVIGLSHSAQRERQKLGAAVSFTDLPVLDEELPMDYLTQLTAKLNNFLGDRAVLILPEECSFEIASTFLIKLRLDINIILPKSLLSKKDPRLKRNNYHLYLQQAYSEDHIQCLVKTLGRNCTVTLIGQSSEWRVKMHASIKPILPIDCKILF